MSRNRFDLQIERGELGQHADLRGHLAREVVGPEGYSSEVGEEGGVDGRCGLVSRSEASKHERYFEWTR